MKKILSLTVVITLLINILSITSFAGNYPDSLYLEYGGSIYKYNSRLVSVVINGKEVKTGDMPAVIIDNTTLVPVREIFESEAIGATVDWNGAKQEVYITYADKFIVLQIDSNIAYVNGESQELDVPAMLVRDLSKDYSKTMIPLRFVSEAMEFHVGWDQETYTALLTGEGIVASTNPEDAAPSTDEPEKNVDSTDVEGEKLDGLTDASANKELPTPLKYNPIQWSATEEQLQEIDESYVDTEIVNEDHSETTIIDVDYEDSSLYKQFIIESDSAMSSVNYFIWDNKFIVDITNSVCDLPAEMAYDDNPIATGVRASQYETVELSGTNSTRVVFDLKDGGNKFQLSFSDDREDLIVTVMDNSIHDIYLGQNEFGDYIRVTGVAAPDVKMFRLSNPDRIVIDFPNTKTVLGFNEAEAEGQYVEKIRTAQFDPTTTRVVVETDGQADYDITKASNGETIIQFTEPGYENIEYDNTDSPTISLDQDEIDISIEGIAYDNDYVNRTYSIILAENYGDLFGDGSLKVNDGIIETIDVTETPEGHTKIVIKSTTVYEYRVEELEDKIQIKAYKPKELYDKIVVVDAGHGGKDPGAMANGLVEKELNLTLTKYLKTLLDENGTIMVYYTRLTDVYPGLQERCDLANEIEADFFLSIHNNAFNPSETGTETLYFPSGASSRLTSPELAKIFHEEMIDLTGNYDRGTKSRENLFVLRHTAMPAIIMEVAFLTNGNDAALLKEDRYLQTVARALYDATLKTFDVYPSRR